MTKKMLLYVLLALLVAITISCRPNVTNEGDTKTYSSNPVAPSPAVTEVGNPPVADAGPDVSVTKDIGVNSEEFFLDGSGSTGGTNANGDEISVRAYEWQVSGYPSGGAGKLGLFFPTTISPKVIVLAGAPAGNYVVSLYVHNGEQGSDIDTVTITVTNQ